MRLIDADRLKVVIGKNMFGTIKEVFNEYVDAQPTVNKWIPVSERLPDEGRLALVTDGKYYGLSELCTDIEDEQCVYWFDEWEDAVAWMPIPEYRGDDNED